MKNYKRVYSEMVALRAKIKEIKREIKLDEAILESGELKDCEYKEVIKDLELRRRLYDNACEELHLLKATLDRDYNTTAFGYDSPYTVGDEYFEKKFKHDGYLIGIRL